VIEILHLGLKILLLIPYSICDSLNSQYLNYYIFVFSWKNKSIFELREISCDKWSLLSAVLDKKKMINYSKSKREIVWRLHIQNFISPKFG